MKFYLSHCRLYDNCTMYIHTCCYCSYECVVSHMIQVCKLYRRLSSVWSPGPWGLWALPCSALIGQSSESSILIGPLRSMCSEPNGLRGRKIFGTYLLLLFPVKQLIDNMTRLVVDNVKPLCMPIFNYSIYMPILHVCSQINFLCSLVVTLITCILDTLMEWLFVLIKATL